MFDFNEYIREHEGTWQYKAEHLKVKFASELDQILRDKNITNAELADELSTSRAYVTKVLKGDANLTLESIAKLCEAVDKQFCFKIAEKQVKGAWLEIISNKNFVNDNTYKLDAGKFITNDIETTYDAA